MQTIELMESFSPYLANAYIKNLEAESTKS